MQTKPVWVLKSSLYDKRWVWWAKFYYVASDVRLQIDYKSML